MEWQRKSGAFFSSNFVAVQIYTTWGGLKTLYYMADEIKITVKQGAKTRFVNAEDVFYIESIGRKAVLHLAEEIIEYYAKISDLEKQLYPEFFRIHRAYLVNLKYVESFNKREVLLKNGDAILISKYRLAEFQMVVSKKENV